MTTETPPIVGVTEAAAIAGMTANHFAVLRKRGQVPTPQIVLACGPIWKRSVIERWVTKRKQFHDELLREEIEEDARGPE